MNYQEALHYLYKLGHETLSMKFGLRNTQILINAFDNPQKCFLKIQIAGTNGKGSVSAFLASICHAANLKVGLYTSPHLIRITERIKINNHEVSPAKFAFFTEKVNQTAENLIKSGQLDALPTFFEHLTAIALLAFREVGLDVAILETGLGGRLDATTASRAEIIGITPISLDHQEYLGDTLRQIAAEKAAVIQEGVRAVIVPQKPEAMQEILKQCQKVSVTPQIETCRYEIIETTTDGRYIATFTTSRDVYPSVCLSLRGKHQLENAALAISLAENLSDFKINVSSKAVIKGLETAEHSGRLELWSNRQPQILFDGAHNVAGATALHSFLKEFIKHPITIVFSAMRDKDLRNIADTLFPFADELILTRVNNLRAASLESLREIVPEDFKTSQIIVAENVAEALKKAREITPSNGTICFTGSLYLIGEAQNILGQE